MFHAFKKIQIKDSFTSQSLSKARGRRGAANHPPPVHTPAMCVGKHNKYKKIFDFHE